MSNPFAAFASYDPDPPVPARLDAIAADAVLRHADGRREAIEESVGPLPRRRRLTPEEIAEHNARLEADRQHRELAGGHLQLNHADLVEYGRQVAEDPQQQAWAAERAAVRRAEREARLRANESGTTRFFRGVMGPLVEAGNHLAKVLPGPASDLYRALGPEAQGVRY